MKNSPRQSNVAGPWRNTSPLHSTVCVPPGACTRTGELTLPVWMEAVAAADEPVPDDIVSPTPRSQKRTSISWSLRSVTNSTLVPCGKSGWVATCPAQDCQSGANSGTNMTKCGLPIDTETPRTVLSARVTSISLPTSGLPIEVRNSKLCRLRLVRSQVLSPAPVLMTADVRLCSAQYHAATHRVPLPEISASEPSALSKRIATSASDAGSTHSTPSAPTPLWRSHICRLKPAMPTGACSIPMIRKSLPQAVDFTKGMEAASRETCMVTARIVAKRLRLRSGLRCVLWHCSAQRGRSVIWRTASRFHRLVERDGKWNTWPDRVR